MLNMECQCHCYLLPRVGMCGRERVVSCVCLSVCLSVQSILAYLGVLGVFKVSFTFVKLAFVDKRVFLHSAFESDHLEARKSLLLATWMLVKLGLYTQPRPIACHILDVREVYFVPAWFHLENLALGECSHLNVLIWEERGFLTFRIRIAGQCFQ